MTRRRAIRQYHEKDGAAFRAKENGLPGKAYTLRMEASKHYLLDADQARRDLIGDNPKEVLYDGTTAGEKAQSIYDSARKASRNTSKEFIRGLSPERR